jgi:hypothetical protein
VPFAYGAAGLTLVAERRLSGFAPVPPAPGDVQIIVGEQPEWHDELSVGIVQPEATPPDITPNLQVRRATNGLAFTYADGCRFWIDRRGVRIWMTFSSSLEDACTYLTGPIIACSLRLRGEFVLHASAVAIGSGAVAFSGPHGAGKSTLAAALGRSGHPVVADDVLRISVMNVGCRAHPFGGILRLWPSGVETVFGTHANLNRITPTWDKRALPIGAEGVPGVLTPVALSAIVFLIEGEADASPAIRRLPASEALLRLTANASASHFLERTDRVREFQQVAAIADSVPCFELRRGEIAIARVVEFVQAEMRRVNAQTPAAARTAASR